MMKLVVLACAIVALIDGTTARHHGGRRHDQDDWDAPIPWEPTVGWGSSSGERDDDWAPHYHYGFGSGEGSAPARHWRSKLTAICPEHICGPWDKRGKKPQPKPNRGGKGVYGAPQIGLTWEQAANLDNAADESELQGRGFNKQSGRSWDNVPAIIKLPQPTWYVSNVAPAPAEEPAPQGRGFYQQQQFQQQQ